MEKLDDIEKFTFTDPKLHQIEEIRRLHERINRLEFRHNDVLVEHMQRIAKIEEWIKKIAKPKDSPTGRQLNP